MAASDVLIALIGPSWLQVAGRDGQPRIADAEDWVAREITFALERGIWIVPVLGDGVAMPTAADLPPSLVALARRNAVHVRHESFPVDVDYLLTVPDRTLRPAASEPPSLAEPSRARLPRRTSRCTCCTLNAWISPVGTNCWRRCTHG